MEKYRKGEKLNGGDLKAIICVLPLAGSNDKPSHYVTKPKIIERLEKLSHHWSTYFETDLADESASLDIATNDK